MMMMMMMMMMMNAVMSQCGLICSKTDG